MEIYILHYVCTHFWPTEENKTHYMTRGNAVTFTGSQIITIYVSHISNAIYTSSACGFIQKSPKIK